MTSDKKKTNMLTKLGYLFLKNMGCYEISTEVKIPWTLIPNISGWEVYKKNRRHTFIDLVGLQFEYLPVSKQYEEKIYLEISDKPITKKVIKKPILRGIEVKVSRSDFKNGFIHVGCHYNYLMVPKGLVSFKEIHKNVGIIEVDLEQCGMKIRKTPFYARSLVGIKLVRKPRRQKVSKRAVEIVQNQIGRTLTNQVKRWLLQDFTD